MEAKELLALNVVRIRKLENLTQTALAKKIGITRKHLCKIEKGETFPSSEILSSIAKGLGVPIKELFSDPEELQNIDLYSHSQRAMERLLPTISRMLTEEIIKDISDSFHI